MPDRGSLMGNRGCLHGKDGEIRRHHSGNRWIYCRLEFKGRKREIMQPGQYTELFFLDEATALAAGHRPCAECMRERFDEFREIWSDANGWSSRVTAAVLNEELQKERVDEDGFKVTFRTPLSDLPDGTMVSISGVAEPHLIWKDQLHPWSAGGYGTGVQLKHSERVEVLTPKSTVRALAAGFSPHVAIDG